MAEKNILLLLNDKDPVLTRVSRTKYEHEAGWKAIIPASFDEAVDVFESQKPDAVVTEIILNDVNGRSGFEFIERISKQAKKTNCHIVILTDLSQESDKQRAKDLGVTYYFVKSQISLKDFIGEMKKILGE